MITPPYDRTGRINDPCSCEFDPYPDSTREEINGEEGSWHHRRTCEFCGFDDWWTLSCPHEKSRPCPGCGQVMEIVRDYHPEKASSFDNPVSGA